MIADPDVNNEDVSKRYTHDNIQPLSFYGGTKKVDLGFVSLNREVALFNSRFFYSFWDSAHKYRTT